MSFLVIRFLILSAVEVSLLPCLAAADSSADASAKTDDFALSGYTEVGRRSTAEDYEEEDADEDYTYRNYHLKLEQEVSQRFTPLETPKHLDNKIRSLTGLSYDISSFIYDKDYKASDSLDNIFRIFKTNWSYYLKKLKEESLDLDLRLEYKQKRYHNAPISEYDQIKAAPTLTVKKKDLYTIGLTLGMDNFDYLQEDQKDEFKVFTQVAGKRYILDKKLLLSGSYKLENTEQKKIGRKRTKNEVMAGFDYSFGLPWIYKIAQQFEWGGGDTKEEERDEDYDYKYWRYLAKTEHRINPKLKTNLKYQYFKKDYLIADLDHRGFYIRNEWDYEVLNDEKQRLWLDFDLAHKDVKYNLRSGNDYKKETLEAKASYKRKKDWEISIGLEENFYDFDAKDNDKKRTYLKLSAEKLFLAGDLTLSAEFKYRYTDYEQKEDKQDEAMRLAFRYKF